MKPSKKKKKRKNAAQSQALALVKNINSLTSDGNGSAQATQDISMVLGGQT